ncbi:efflux RND transporter periplasmic adaptor subunit [Desulfobacula sp.]|uniref:efflux RND transporter periplasmic adaptor subunit n=1 Tax=Desulfobacula sp. TaxID=2593537 RepID=UPI0026031BCA|nr:efflux RND transporter periplasmic adaptor subunit [Desulfobacula sp.]
MSERKTKGSALRLLIRIAVPVCLILAGVAGFNYFKSREVTLKRKPPLRQAAVVETLTLEPGNYQSYVTVMGKVMPDKEIILKAQVSGEVVSISEKFVQGGLMKKGETLLRLEDSDYQIAVQKAQSAVNKALSDLAIERGSQLIAKEELKLINEVSPVEMTGTDLALRKPQLVQANAVVESARADLEQARLNLSRTRVRVPFNALILEKQVDSGSLVPAQGTLATLVDVDAYQVEAVVPPDRLAALRINETTGSEAIIHSQYSQQTWKGKVVRTTGKITDKSRMAGVIILVADPLGLKGTDKRPPLLLADHVDVRIMGPRLENVFSLPRSLLRDGNTVWVYRSGVLEIRAVGLAWKEDGVVYVNTGIRTGDAVITSDLPAPVKGMALQSASGGRP